MDSFVSFFVINSGDVTLFWLYWAFILTDSRLADSQELVLNALKEPGAKLFERERFYIILGPNIYCWRLLENLISGARAGKIFFCDTGVQSLLEDTSSIFDT